MATAAKKVPVEKEEKAKPTAVTSPAWGGGPLAESLHSLRDEIDRAFENAFRGWPSLFAPGRALWDWDPFRGMAAPFAGAPGELAPRTDVSETDEAYTVTVELPGVDEKDLEVSVSEGTLTVTGEKKSEREEEEKGHYLSERSYGRFRRMFRIPEDADANKVSAEFTKGVLTVTMPKTPEAKKKVRKVAIKAK